MSDLPPVAPRGTPEVTRKMRQPQDEVPEIFQKDGRLFSPDPSAPKERAVFEVEEIVLTFDQRPLFTAVNEFQKVHDLTGFVKCFENCTMDIKTIGSHVYVTLKPGV